jgi:Putative Ig domain
MIRNSNRRAHLLKGALVFCSLSLFNGLLGCGSSTTPTPPPPPPPPTGVTIQGPASSNVDPGDSASFTAAVQNDSTNAGVTWTVSGTGCTGSACGALSSSTTTGVMYTAPATVGTAFTVTVTATSVTDTSLSATASLSVPVNPAISTAAGDLAGGMVGMAYSVTLAAAGGIAPYTWTVTSGALPAGLSLNGSTGAITGTPTAAGSPSFTVTLTDTGSPALTATATFSIAIAAAPAIVFSTTTLAGGTVGTAYAATVAATGGAGTLTYVLGSGTLPAGLSLSRAGAITGTPIAAGTSMVTVKATDAYGDTGTSGSFSIVVVNPLTVTTMSLPKGAVGTAYSATLAASGGTGMGYTWTLTSGNLSTVGLSLSSAGVISGATPILGSVSFTVTVTDSGRNTATETIALTVGPPGLAVTTTSLPIGVVGDAYTATLAAISGTGTGYKWTLTSGSLSSVGLSLSSAGVISGATPIVGSATFTVTVTDSGGDTATATLTVTINPGVTITTTSLPNGTEGTAYSATLAASGGTGADYMWTVTSGTGLSAVGLSLSSNGVVTGIPTAGETSVSFAVQVTDSGGNVAAATLQLTVTSVVFQGQVLSGGQGVAGATIQIYAAGSTGNGSAATPMLTQAVTTDSAGFFSIAGDYICGQSSTGTTIAGSNQVYLVATGGSVFPNPSNSALIMVSAVGNCSNLTATSYTYINELTTAAAAWALAPFSTSSTNIGGSSTNILGIQNAFLDAALLANSTTGNVATLATNLSVETGKLNGLADVLFSCTSTSGGSACDALFTAATPSGGTAPADTFTATLNIVKNPGQNVAAVYGTIGSSAPYATTLTAEPNDWTMALTVTGGGLASPTALGIDALNNVWVANQGGPLSAFGPQGAVLSSSTGFGAGDLAQSYGLAIDTSGNIWVTNYNGSSGTGSVTEFLGATSGTIGSAPNAGGYTNSICYATAVAADTNGDVFIANEECSSVTVYNSSANVVDGFLGEDFGLAAKPQFLAVDSSHGVWLSDNDNTIAHIAAPTTANPNGQLLSHPDCCFNSHGLATDAQGNVWVANYLGSTFSEVGSDGTVLINQATGGGIIFPYAVAVDAGQNVWFTNFDNGSFSEIAGSGGTITAGTALSPTTGVNGNGGYGLDATLGEPFSIAPDLSGNLWISDEAENDVVMFFGLATPTVTPLQPVPTAP